MTWTAGRIGKAVVEQTFNRQLLLVPNCLWPGSECDVLGVHRSLRLVEVEIKISRADLKCDPEKEKWGHDVTAPTNTTGRLWNEPRVRVPRGWPRRIWKHYYAAPRECYTDEIIALLPPKSGLIAMYERTPGGIVVAESLRRAQPNPDAKAIEPHEAVDIARLAGLRMWEALADRDRIAASHKECG